MNSLFKFLLVVGALFCVFLFSINQILIMAFGQGMHL